MNKRPININDKFGDYTIISEPYKINNVLFVDIQCKCGKKRKQRTSNILRLNKCKQCNAKDNYRKYKIGTKINHLTLLDYIPHKKNIRTKLKVQCDCSKIFYISSFEFNRTKCCHNCHIKKRGVEHSSYKGTKNITKTYFSQIKLNANKRKLKFNLNINFLDKLLESQNFKCYLSNQKISVHERTASLDRIDSSLDYTKNNVAWIHKDIQRMKSDFSLEYFIKICTKIANNHNPILGAK